MYTPEEIRICHPTYFDKCLYTFDREEKKLPCRKKEVVKDPFESSIISYIGSVLPFAGTLKQTDNGCIYLDIPNEYITSIIPFFKDPTIDKPPYFEGSFTGGAHICVATATEEKKLYSPIPIGEVFSFSVTGCYKSTLIYDIKNKYVFYLTVSSDELQNLRKQMGLSLLPDGEVFHITLAYKKAFLSLNDLITEASKNRITLSESAIVLNKLRESK